ncbi:unnamed protein product [Camellia sinensis]
MKSSTQALPFSAMLILLLLLVAPASIAAITCSDVIKDLRPCISYLKTGSGTPPAACCAGAKALASAATSTADKKTACNCIKSTSKNMKINSKLAKALPGNCGINLGFSVDPNIDCSKDQLNLKQPIYIARGGGCEMVPVYMMKPVIYLSVLYCNKLVGSIL